ncbi:unnamed protein product, partial [Phaeothamnion confervicola]
MAFTSLRAPQFFLRSSEEVELEADGDADAEALVQRLIEDLLAHNDLEEADGRTIVPGNEKSSWHAGKPPLITQTRTGAADVAQQANVRREQRGEDDFCQTCEGASTRRSTEDRSLSPVALPHRGSHGGFGCAVHSCTRVPKDAPHATVIPFDLNHAAAGHGGIAAFRRLEPAAPKWHARQNELGHGARVGNGSGGGGDGDASRRCREHEMEGLRADASRQICAQAAVISRQCLENRTMREAHAVAVAKATAVLAVAESAAATAESAAAAADERAERLTCALRQAEDRSRCDRQAVAAAAEALRRELDAARKESARRTAAAAAALTTDSAARDDERQRMEAAAAAPRSELAAAQSEWAAATGLAVRAESARANADAVPVALRAAAAAAADLRADIQCLHAELEWLRAKTESESEQERRGVEYTRLATAAAAQAVSEAATVAAAAAERRASAAETLVGELELEAAAHAMATARLTGELEEARRDGDAATTARRLAAEAEERAAVAEEAASARAKAVQERWEREINALEERNVAQHAALTKQLRCAEADLERTEAALGARLAAALADRDALAAAAAAAAAAADTRREEDRREAATAALAAAASAAAAMAALRRELEERAESGRQLESELAALRAAAKAAAARSAQGLAEAAALRAGLEGRLAVESRRAALLSKERVELSTTLATTCREHEQALHAVERKAAAAAAAAKALREDASASAQALQSEFDMFRKSAADDRRECSRLRSAVSRLEAELSDERAERARLAALAGAAETA